MDWLLVSAMYTNALATKTATADWIDMQDTHTRVASNRVEVDAIVYFLPDHSIHAHVCLEQHDKS
jgi:hypothetical protein